MIPPHNEFIVLADRFLAMLRNERGASEHTVRAYAREVRSFAEFLGEKLGKDGADRCRRAPAYPCLHGTSVRSRA